MAQSRSNPRPLGDITLHLPLLINEEFKESHLILLMTNECFFSLSPLSFVSALIKIFFFLTRTGFKQLARGGHHFILLLLGRTCTVREHALHQRWWPYIIIVNVHFKAREYISLHFIPLSAAISSVELHRQRHITM